MSPPARGESTPSTITALTAGFSPVGAPEYRKIAFAISIGEPESVVSWTVRVISGSVAIKEFAGDASSVSDRLEWDGRTDGGKAWPEGEYYAILSVDYGKAFEPSRGAYTKFNLVAGPPELSIQSAPAFFTPAGLGMAEPVALALKARSEYAKIDSWSIELLDPRGEKVKGFSGSGAEAQAQWDGQTFGGAFVEPSKRYKALAKAIDQYGNVAITSIEIPVLAQPNAPEASMVRPSAPGFSPTGDPSRRNMTLALSIGNKEAVKSWAVDIVAGSVVLKRMEGKAPNFPASVSWDGRSETGSPWPEGEYFPVLSVDYGQAFNPVKVAGEKFLLIATAPSLSLSTSPNAFTPQGEGMAEAVKISLEANSKRAKITNWSMTIFDARGIAVRGFEGSGQKGEALWDGRLASKAFAEPAQTYTARVTSKDEYGNAGEASIAIPVRDLKTAPEASLIATEARGFSPKAQRANGQIEFSLKIGAADSMRSWKVEIADKTGAKKTFSGAFGEQPTSIFWDGKDDTGYGVPEGTYFAALTVDYGRTFKPASVTTKEFILSLSPPTARLSLAPEAFVPSEKGVAGPVSILLEANSKLGRVDSWTIDILDPQGRIVRAFAQSWPANQAVWNGMTLAGTAVEPATTYTARATVLDEFGNSTIATAPVMVKEIPAPTEPSLVEPRLPGFSPLAIVGKPRTIDFIVRAGNREQLKAWKLTLSHSERGAQRVFEGTTAGILDKPFVWDGKTAAGELAPDGSYAAILSLDYGKSFKPGMARSSSFLLQSAAPEVSLTLSAGGLVPKNGSFEKPVDMAIKASSRFADIEGWTISILDAKENEVAQFKSAGSKGSASWNGKTSNGGIAEPASTYTAAAEVRDSFGNAGIAKARIAVADLPPVPGENSVTPLSSGFSPNGDGLVESIDLMLSIAHKEALNSWTLAVRDASGKTVKAFSGDKAGLREKLNWEGRTDTGVIASEGAYDAELSLNYGAVYKAASVKSRKFVLALSPPTGAISISPSSPVPDEKGFVSPAIITVDARSALARLASWEVQVTDQAGATLASYESEWPPKPIAWDGVSTDGKLAEPELVYSVLATVRDEFGIAAKLTAPIKVASLSAPTETNAVIPLSRGFSPAVKSLMRFNLAFGNLNLIKSWKLDIERDDKTVRMSWPGDPEIFPESFSWDGKLQDGTLAPDGRYLATLSVDYGRAYAPSVVSSGAFLLVATAPQATLNVEPPIFSPDGDGEAETATISLNAASRYAKINDYTIDVSDPGGNLFHSFRDSWPAKPISWDGKNAKGELVESAEDYPIVARVRDEFGNSTELKSKINVDILVIKSGDGYRIRVASIVFKSFTADYKDVPPDRAEANLETLNRLAEKLKKYPGYQIKLVGHAVMVNWDDPALGKAEQEKVLLPLSRSRAEAIRQALAVRGIEAMRMTTEGVGASDQIVPDSDFANRWKNRRVEFFLQKKK